MSYINEYIIEVDKSKASILTVASSTDTAHQSSQPMISTVDEHMPTRVPASKTTSIDGSNDTQDIDLNRLPPFILKEM